MRMAKIAGATLAMVAVAAAIAAGSASCSQTPTNVAVRTFQQAQKVAVVCVAVNDANGNPLTYDQLKPLPQDQCSPVPVNGNGAVMPNHLYATVTQLTRGELAVVDLTAGNVVDEDRSTPGINFIPVGADPTDVAITDDGANTFVSSADPNKPAIYAIDNRRLLGDSTGVSDGGAPAPAPLQLTDLAACALPQPPQALVVASNAKGAKGTNVLLAVLRASAGAPANVVAIDPGPLTSSSAMPGTLPACSAMGATRFSGALPPAVAVGPAWADGVPYVDGGIDVPLPSLGPSCSSPSAGGADAGGGPDGGSPSEAGAPLDAGGITDAGAASDSGDGGLPLSFGPLNEPHPISIALRDDVHLLYVADDAVPLIHVIDLSDPSSPKEMPPLLATSVADPSRRVAVGPIALSPPTRDYKRYLYAVDARVGTLMVYDVTDPVASPHVPLVRPHPELVPLQEPDRVDLPGPVASVAFVQHDWPVPQPGQGNPMQQYTGLLCNPNPNAWSSAGSPPAALGAYYRADQAGAIQSSGTVEGFPQRLRGIFAFATLYSGSLVAIDVDDWDAPCRRPDPMDDGGIGVGSAMTSDGGASQGILHFGQTGVLDQPELAPDGGDLDPYHAPFVFPVRGAPGATTNVTTQGVTEEAFFPVSQPHRLRSNFLVANDPVSGNHAPNLLGLPQLFDMNGAPLPIGQAAQNKPLILPTALPPGFWDPSYFQNPTQADPGARAPTSVVLATAYAQSTMMGAQVLIPGASTTTTPAVRISFDDPTAHFDQDWTVDYEGALPSVSGVVANLLPHDTHASAPAPDDYTLTFDASGANFCARGVEDWSLGQQRAQKLLMQLAAANLPASGVLPPGSGPTLDRWTADYVEITDDLPAQGDPYWNLPSSANDCWDDGLADNTSTAFPNPNGPAQGTLGDARYNACNDLFSDAADADTHLARDFPILEAHNGYLVVGRFGWDPNQNSEQTTNRVIVGPDPSNRPFLRRARCCFHNQAGFKVRAGGEWVTSGSTVGLLHHVIQASTTDDRCVLSCDPRYALLNGRSFDVPWANPVAGACSQPQNVDLTQLDRNSPLAMRNPMFSFITWSGCGQPAAPGDHTLTARDYTWKFSMRGGFNPLQISLTQGTNTFVSPQSMLFIDALGQLAVVDGAQQGLVLIDLNTLAFAHAPYY